MTGLATPEYLITAAFIGVYFLLKANLLPAVSKRIDARSFLVIVFCAIVVLNLDVDRRAMLPSTQVDRQSSTERALRKLAAALPDVPRVGFKTDIDRSDRATWLEPFFLTRYVLAPRLVEEGAGPEWVVVIATDVHLALAADDLALVQDFGDGVRLFRQKAR